MSDNDNGSNESDAPTCGHVILPGNVMYRGLKLVGYRRSRIKRATDAENTRRFRAHFGINPATACTIYEDLQNSEIEEVRMEGSDAAVKFLLIALNFLRKYPHEDDLEARFDYSSGWLRKKIWEVVEKIKSLKHEKIVWPDNFEEDEMWVVTVDGIHCWIQESSSSCLRDSFFWIVSRTDESRLENLT
jgi:hypothetical protein